MLWQSLGSHLGRGREGEGHLVSCSWKAAKSKSSDTAGLSARTTSDPRGLLSGGGQGAPERTVALGLLGGDSGER